MKLVQCGYILDPTFLILCYIILLIARCSVELSLSTLILYSFASTMFTVSLTAVLGLVVSSQLVSAAPTWSDEHLKVNTSSGECESRPF
jgi:hypothetical protein